MDVATLAASTVGSLLVPYFKKGADKLVEAVAAKVGEGVGKQLASAARSAWEIVKEALTSDQEITTLRLFENAPETFQEPVRLMLEQNLNRNPQLAEKLQAILSAPGPGGTTSSIITNAGVAGILNMQGATVSGSSGNIFAGVKMTPPGPPGEKNQGPLPPKREG